MKPYVAHYKNKYPGSRVQVSEDALDVYDVNGEHVVALRKNGAGQVADVSEEYGCRDRHDLAPIPVDSRVHKLGKDGKLGLDEKAAERREKVKALAENGRVPSIDELEKRPKGPQA